MYFEKKIYDKVGKLETLVSDIKDEMKIGRKNLTLPLKNPKTSVEWVLDEALTRDVYATFTSFPDKILHGEARQAANEPRKIFKYGVLGDADTLEFGIETSIMEGYLKFMHVTPKSVVYVTSTFGGPDDPPEKTWIYKAPDIFTEPTLILENDSGQAIGMSCHSHYDGFTDIILVSMYGRSRESKKRDLLMSVDGGDTFRTIKQTTGDTSQYNSHWHATWYDKYEGIIWASEGDTTNRNIHYTKDYGATWETMEGDKDWEDRHQPTLIFGWSERVMFGRDSSQKYTGLDSYERNQTTAEREGYQKLIDKYTLNTNQIASFSYPENGVCVTEDGQAYVMFRIDNKNATQLIATGDYGRSWHGIFATERDNSSFRTQMTFGAIENKYMGAVISSHHELKSSRLMYAKLLEWE